MSKVFAIKAKETFKVDGTDFQSFIDSGEVLSIASSPEKALELIRKYADYFESHDPDEISYERTELDNGWRITFTDGCFHKATFYATEFELDKFEIEEA